MHLGMQFVGCGGGGGNPYCTIECFADQGERGWKSEYCFQWFDISMLAIYQCEPLGRPLSPFNPVLFLHLSTKHSGCVSPPDCTWLIYKCRAELHHKNLHVLPMQHGDESPWVHLIHHSLHPHSTTLMRDSKLAPKIPSRPTRHDSMSLQTEGLY